MAQVVTALQTAQTAVQAQLAGAATSITSATATALQNTLTQLRGIASGLQTTLDEIEAGKYNVSTMYSHVLISDRSLATDLAITQEAAAIRSALTGVLTPISNFVSVARVSGLISGLLTSLTNLLGGLVTDIRNIIAAI